MVDAAAAIAALTAAFERPLAYAAEQASGGRPVIAVSAASVPAELLRASGAVSVVLRWPPEPTPRADEWLEPGVFTHRIRALVDAALDGRLALLRALVIPRTSEQDYKAYLYIREIGRERDAPRMPPVVLFDLLQSRSADVRKYGLARTRALAGTIEAMVDCAIVDADLAVAIQEANAARAAARRLLHLRQGRPRVKGTEILPLVGALHIMPYAQYTSLADLAFDELASRPVLDGPRVLIIGAVPDHLVLHQALESHGAVVSGEASAWGSRAAEADVSTAQDPMTAIFDRYYAVGDGARRPSAEEDAWVERALDEADGVVFSLPADDSVYGWDYPRQRRLVDARAIPHLVLRHVSTDASGVAAREDVARFVDHAATARATRHAR